MARGQRKESPPKAQLKARSLLYGRRRLGSGISQSVAVEEVLREIGSGKGSFFARLGLSTAKNQREKMVGNEPDRYRQTYQCDLYRGGQRLCSFDHYLERGDDGDRHIFAISRRTELGPPKGALDNLGREIGAIAPGAMLEININQFDDFNQDWIDEIKAGKWSLASPDIENPLRPEKQIIKEMNETFKRDSRAETLRELILEEGGEEFIEERVRGGFIYLRQRLG